MHTVIFFSPLFFTIKTGDPLELMQDSYYFSATYRTAILHPLKLAHVN